MSTTEPQTEPSAARESPLHEGVRLERRLPAFYAAFFYAFPAAIAWVWLTFAQSGRSAQLWAPEAAPRGTVIGAAAGALVVAASLLCGRLFSWARRLEAEFGWILGAQKRWEIVWVALLSGFAEEYLFRGALQEKVGIWMATAIFAAVHWPVNRSFLAWPFVAGVIGLGLGGLRLWTGALWAPAVAHAAVNLANLWRIKARFRDWDEARVKGYIETGR